jgi:uncharacterized membrane protein
MARQFRIFLQGLVVTVPIALTLYVLWVTVHWMDVNIRHILPIADELPGMGIIVAILTIYLVGALTNVLIFQNLLENAERMIDRVPLVKTLYGSVRDMLQFFGNKARPAGEAVKIAISEDAHMLGITTGATGDDDRVAVYMPFSYQIGGYLVYLPKEKLEATNMNVESALKLILTGGIGATPESENSSTESP